MPISLSLVSRYMSRARGLCVVVFALFAGTLCARPLQIVASTNDLAAVARQLGGARVSVTSICTATQDPHTVELLPAQVLAVKSAAVYLKVGLALDRWADDLIQASGNETIRVADCSAHVVPIRGRSDSGEDDRGDHPDGNPHYWLGPLNLLPVANDVTAALCDADAAGAPEYRANLATFTRSLTDSVQVWRAALADCRTTSVLVFHATWDYFARDFHWNIAAAIEPRPGVEPAPREIAALLSTIREQHVRLCLIEPYTQSALIDLLRRDAGIQVVTLPASVGDNQAATTFDLVRAIVNLLSANCNS
jgi:zinc/manganese transport system substrate-binding protein